MNGGYIMIKASDADIYLEASRALTIGKPILFYENDTTCYYIDTITLDGTNVVLTKGGKTITIANDNTITSVGDIINALMENIKDANGHLRFIDGDGTPKAIEGVEYSYCKWSLSGSHLMLVLAGSIEDTTVLTQYNFGAEYTLPEWIYNKIYPVWGTSQLEVKAYNLRADDWSTQSLNMSFSKSTNNRLVIQNSQATLTLTADRSFRFQFDLLIDNE